MNIFLLIIGIPVFFSLRWLFKRYISDRRRRNIATWTGTIVLTAVLYVAAVYIFFSILFHEPERKFDQVSWSADRTHRFQMADNIIKNKLLIGKDTAQVKALLGDTHIKYYGSNQQTIWTYDMGNGGGGLGFLFHSLAIEFRENKAILVSHQEIAD